MEGVSDMPNYCSCWLLLLMLLFLCMLVVAAVVDGDAV